MFSDASNFTRIGDFVRTFCKQRTLAITFALGLFCGNIFRSRTLFDRRERPVTDDAVDVQWGKSVRLQKDRRDNNTLHTEPRAARLLETMIFAAAR